MTSAKQDLLEHLARELKNYGPDLVNSVMKLTDEEWTHIDFQKILFLSMLQLVQANRLQTNKIRREWDKFVKDIMEDEELDRLKSERDKLEAWLLEHPQVHVVLKDGSTVSGAEYLKTDGKL